MNRAVRRYSQGNQKKLYKAIYRFVNSPNLDRWVVDWQSVKPNGTMTSHKKIKQPIEQEKEN